MSEHRKNNLNLSDDSAIRRLSGKGIQFDAKGNAVYQGSMEHLLRSPLMEQSLQLETDALGTQPATQNGFGYNPYAREASSGATTRTRKLDMRELSKWIELKKRVAAQREDDPAD